MRRILPKPDSKQTKFLIVLILPIVLFLLLRIPSIIEPYWYNDEGIYAAIATQMLEGGELYIDAWDHKPPGIFLIYTAIGFISKAADIDFLILLRSINLILGLVTVLLSVKLSKKFFNFRGQVLSSILVALAIGLPVIEGNILNAENIFLPLTLLAYLLFFNSLKDNTLKTSSLISIGLLFGLAFLIKVQPILELLGILTVIAAFYYVKKKGFTNPEFIKNVFTVCIATLIPISFVYIFYGVNGNIGELVFANFTYNFGYASDGNSVDGLSLVTQTAILFLGIISVLFLYFKKLLHKNVFYVLIWFLLALTGVSLSGRPYPHYILQLIVPGVLLFTIGLTQIYKKNRMQLAVITSALLLPFIILPVGQYDFGYIESTKNYYVEGYRELFGNNEENWNRVFDYNRQKTAILNEIVEHYGDNIWILDNTSWYIWDNTLISPTRYIVAFHIDNERSFEVVEDIRKANTKVIALNNLIVLPDAITELIQEDYSYENEYRGYTIYKLKSN
jgi:hypothetical protein